MVAFARFAGVVLLVLVGACAPAASGGTADPAVRATSAGIAPRATIDEQVSLCLDVAVAAAQLSHAQSPVVTHGTVTSGTASTYDPAPADALVLIKDGATTRYTVARAAFDTAVGTIAEAFLRPHDVACHASRADAFDLELASSDTGGTTARTGRGTVVNARTGDNVEVTLHETGTNASTLDGSSLRYDSTAARTLRVLAEGLDVNTTEDDTHVIVLVDNAAENRTTVVSVDAIVDSAHVVMDGGRIRRSFLDGVPDEADFWGETAGTVTKDGGDAGALAFKQSAAAFEIVLAQESGDTVLESWAF